MSNTIGSLQIDVLANIANMVSDLGKAQQEANRFAREVRSQVTEQFDFIKDKAKEVAVAVGVAFSAERLVEFGKRAAEQAEKVNNLSQSLGVSTQAIQNFAYAAALTGGSLDTVSTSLTKLERSAVQAQSGNAQMIEGFRAIGVSVTDSSGKFKSADALFQEVSQHISQFADSPTKVAVAMQLMGRGAAENIPFLNKLGSQFDDLKAQALAFGLVLTDKDQAVT